MTGSVKDVKSLAVQRRGELLEEERNWILMWIYGEVSRGDLKRSERKCFIN